MKITFFSKILIVAFLFGGISANAQVRVKTNRSNNKKKVVVKTNRNTHHNRSGVRVKTNRHRIVVNKPNRPRVIVNRPNYNRAGYIWIEGYWEWNAYYGRYIWQKARWKKIKRNHIWIPGFWEATSGGFFWIEGYWELEF